MPLYRWSAVITASLNLYSLLARPKAAQLFSPYALLLQMALLMLLVLSISRLGLVLWQYERVSAVTSPFWLMLHGVRADLIILGIWLAPAALVSLILLLPGTLAFWRKFCYCWVLLGTALFVLIEASTVTFISQYDLRPNRLFVEYLRYPDEVFGMLWQGFRLELFSGLLLWALLLRLAVKCFKPAAKQLSQPGRLAMISAWVLMVVLLFLTIRSTIQHRPANPALFAITSDAMVNSLFISSPYSVYYALYSLRHETRSSEIYGQLPQEQILQQIRQEPWLSDRTYLDPQLPTLSSSGATQPLAKPKNLVIILLESTGSTFVESLGGLPVTPELEQLKQQGWWFERMYATGTRSVRGIEAVLTGFLPTPAQSVVKLSGAQHNFFTLAELLGQQQYHTEFVYGGEAHFDNMRSFFTGNGFEQIVDIEHIKDPVFVGSWGASDEDLFRTALERFDQLSAQPKPFFSLVFTSTNHEPFEFPDGRISLHQEPKATAANAVKYTDKMLGDLFRQLQSRDYYDDTLFLIVADHDVRVYGPSLVPFERFHIPALLVGGGLSAKQIKPIASQIDLAPTLLSLLGIQAKHPMIGRDFSLDDQSPGRAMMVFDPYFGLLEDHGFTVLKPDQTAIRGQYDFASRKATTENRSATEQERQRALAYALLPSWLYRDKLYRLPQCCQTASSVSAAVSEKTE